MRPTVSVVMAAKNYAKFIGQAIDSVLAQTFADWELLVIDDGSTDATPAAVRPYLADRRVKYVRSDVLGQPRAKNLGIGLSAGEFVAYLDADDAWEPTKLEKQLAILRSDTNVGVCFSGRRIMNENGVLAAVSPSVGFQRGDVLRPLFLKNFVCFSSVVVRRTVFDHVGHFDPALDLAIDYDLWLRVAAHHQFDFVDEPLVLYRTGHGNLSKKLWDRVDTADAIMTRAVFRRGLRKKLPRREVGEGYASTYRAIGYVMRDSEPLTAARWYWRALMWPGDRVAAAKGIVASLLKWARGRRLPAVGENASANR